MNLTMITERHNHDDGYIALVDIELANMPDSVTVSGMTLLKKDEFHVSIIALKHLAPLINPEQPDIAEKELVRDFIEFQKEHELADFALSGDHYLVKRDDRVTIVSMVQLDGVNELYDTLRQKYQLEFPTQPTHITTYTLQPNKGIGLFSRAELEASATRLHPKELDRMCKA